VYNLERNYKMVNYWALDNTNSSRSYPVYSGKHSRSTSKGLSHEVEKGYYYYGWMKHFEEMSLSIS
jgi:hypothetical protein